MIPGRLAVASDDSLPHINQAARRILAGVGMRAHPAKILRFCAQARARVDAQARAAKFPAELIDALTPLVRCAAGCSGSSGERCSTVRWGRGVRTGTCSTAPAVTGRRCRPIAS